MAVLGYRAAHTHLGTCSIYRDIIEAWLSFHDVTTVRNMYIPPIL